MIREKICGIYKITSPSKKVYIGQSIDCLKREKFYKGIHCKGQIRIYRSILKYGWASHHFDIIHICESGELNNLEKYYVELYNSTDENNGLNLKTGGGSICKFTNETRIRMSKARIGIIVSDKTKEINRKRRLEPQVRIEASKRMEGDKNPMWGKSHSEETKKKIGEKSKLKIYSDEYKEKIRVGNIGKKQSDEAKKKISNSKIKIVLNTRTGIFYYGVIEAAKSEGILYTTLYSKLNGNLKNNTPFIYT